MNTDDLSGVLIADLWPLTKDDPEVFLNEMKIRMPFVITLNTVWEDEKSCTGGGSGTGRIDIKIYPLRPTPEKLDTGYYVDHGEDCYFEDFINEGQTALWEVTDEASCCSGINNKIDNLIIVNSCDIDSHEYDDSFGYDGLFYLLGEDIPFLKDFFLLIHKNTDSIPEIIRNSEDKFPDCVYAFSHNISSFMKIDYKETLIFFSSPEWVDYITNID
jgi:hypothetical protein